MSQDGKKNEKNDAKVFDGGMFLTAWTMEVSRQ
jgi:hypothetical protein